MAVSTPDNGQQVEDRIKVDVQRSAPDSNPYLKVHWLRSLIAGLSLRLYDLYRDLRRTEDRLALDTQDDEFIGRYGAIIVGPKNAASFASGNVVATGTAGTVIPSGTALTGTVGYVSDSAATISAQSISITSINRSGTTATVITAGDHGLSSFVPVTMSGLDQSEYNLTDAEITVTGSNSFSYQVAGSPTTPATGTGLVSYTTASVAITATESGTGGNLDLDSSVTLDVTISGVDSTLYVDFGAIGGGSDTESSSAYRLRYLEKVRNPVAHFNASDITTEAKKVTGVTRVFVEPAGSTIGQMSVSSLTRSGNVATATITNHGLDDGATITITGAVETDYNVIESRIIVEDANTIHYVVFNSPTTPATGTISASAKLPLGQVRTFFMRDNDPDPIPSASEVQTVKDQIETIKPANTSSFDNIVRAPTPNVTNYVFTELNPNTATMQSAIRANLAQFHDEQTTVGVDDDEKAYEAAIKNTVDPETGDTVISFTLSSPSGDLINGSGEISTLGTVTYP